MSLKAVSLLILLHLLCSGLSAQETSVKSRNDQHRMIRTPTSEVRSSNTGGLEQALRTGKGKYTLIGTSDREKLSRKRRTENELFFDCGRGIAIPFDEVCDEFLDCENGLDEVDCQNIICPDDYYKCDDEYGGCYHYTERCDGFRHCIHYADERNCVNLTCPYNHYRCDDSGPCYLIVYRCDGFQLCFNNADEENCLSTTCPNEDHYFRCNSGQCILQVYRCNQEPNCEDQSDESDCFPKSCPDKYYKCPDGTCKGRMHFCELVYVDSFNHLDICPRPHGITNICHNYTCFITDNIFQCNTGDCINKDTLCDESDDCPDGSDELMMTCRLCADPTDYQCVSGHCLPWYYRCDMYEDCPDYSDEISCENFICPFQNYSQCATGHCIPLEQLCNNAPDCPDGSDEMSCENFTCPYQNYFQCATGHCIPIEQMCNLDHDCPDGSDEMSCENFTCPYQNYFQCATGHCIPIEQLCNHDTDCPNGSDESSCLNRTCESLHEFRCDNGECVSKWVQCDNIADCSDGSDEFKCQSSCPYLHYSCDFDRCYPMYKHCDGRQDCLNNYDESNCQNDTVCHFTHSACAIKSSQCVPWFFLCDGIIDCNDTSDELNCDNTTLCPADTYKCSNGRCVILSFICDHKMQRDYGFSLCSDEPDNVTCNTHVCMDDFAFRCKTGHCIAKSKRCNFRLDCPDGSDEDDCGTKCDTQTFTCSNGLCIDESAVCNRIVDCSDGGDERYCYRNACSSSNYQCKSGHCIRMPGLCNGYFEYSASERCPVFHDDEKFCSFVKCPLHYLRMPTGACTELKDQTNISCSTSKKSDVCSGNCPNDLYYLQCCNCQCVHRVSICDGINDCPDGADERNCGRAECRADQFYCGNITCFPLELKCDGFSHCPYGHDETNCTLNETTTFTGHKITVIKPKNAVTHNEYQEACFDPSICFTAKQICLSTGRCQMEIDNKNCFVLCSTPCVCQPVGQIFCNQRVENRFSSLKHDSTVLWPFNTSSHIYSLNSNIGKSLFFTFETISTVSITYASLKQVPTRLLSCAFNIQYLNLSHNAITHIAVGDFGRLYLLAVLDLSNNLISSIEDFSFKGIRVLELRLDENKILDFGINLFSGIAVDRSIKTDAYRFCCIRPPYLPEQNCYPKADPFSSCKDLMKNTVLSVIVWIIGLVTLFGNVAVILFTLMVEKDSFKKNHGLMIVNLAFADALMGVYLLSIGSVDAMYRGIYITKDYEWRNSSWCSLVGAVCMISSEASLFFICLITLDRYLIVKYPFGQVRLSRSHIMLISICIWITSITTAVIPLIITPYFQGAFYRKSGVCIALPLTTESYDGWEYSFAVSVCLNFIILVIVGVGQFLIVKEIVLSERQSRLISSRRRNDFKIAIKLMFIVISDVCCWVPIGVLGIMALAGFEIHPDTYAWVVVFVLPINSTLNPFLYTIISQLSRYMKRKNADKNAKRIKIVDQ